MQGTSEQRTHSRALSDLNRGASVDSERCDNHPCASPITYVVFTCTCVDVVLDFSRSALLLAAK